MPKIIKSNEQLTSFFNYPVNLQEITTDNIYVKNEYDELSDISLVANENNRKMVIIKPPALEGNYYILTHNKNITSDGGNCLDQENIFYFYVPMGGK